MDGLILLVETTISSVTLGVEEDFESSVFDEIVWLYISFWDDSDAKLSVLIDGIGIDVDCVVKMIWAVLVEVWDVTS